VGNGLYRLKVNTIKMPVDNALLANAGNETGILNLSPQGGNQLFANTGFFG